MPFSPAVTCCCNQELLISVRSACWVLKQSLAVLQVVSLCAGSECNNVVSDSWMAEIRIISKLTRREACFVFSFWAIFCMGEVKTVNIGKAHKFPIVSPQILYVKDQHLYLHHTSCKLSAILRSADFDQRLPGVPVVCQLYGWC